VIVCTEKKNKNTRKVQLQRYFHTCLKNIDTWGQSKINKRKVKKENVNTIYTVGNSAHFQRVIFFYKCIDIVWRISRISFEKESFAILIRIENEWVQFMYWINSQWNY
jgi:hypothetical protein